MKKFKRILCIGISISLLHVTPSYAVLVVPPPPVNGNQNTESASNGPGAPEESKNQPNQPVSNEMNQSTAVQAPIVQAQGAVLMDAATGRLLYEKNANTQFYPASITKLMTALLAVENSRLDETVNFSAAATTNLESGSVSLNIVEGDKLSVKDCLYALLLKSANEVANGLAEHVAGSIDEFAVMMNKRAAALGCTNTHFANPNGLNNSNHYTTPRDMALIAREAFKNQTVCKVASTLSYQIPATKKAGARTVTIGHKMLYPSDSRYYPGIIGGKTGYTSLAGNTLVTCVEKDGVRLIAVVMKSKSTQYTDTIAMLDYGFKNRSVLGLAGETAVSSGKWVQEGTRWYYQKDNGNRAANEWLTINGSDYWFDSDSYMATGWRQFDNGSWYYFKSNGVMAVNCWEKNDAGQWFYLGSDGAMLTNTTTPDGFSVDANGQWIQQ